ncbi:hypothetical protein TNCV_1460521 [Trichonephila clavipes]|nr:hypothetical protein TNCV_1460521 [Trichonephila clavipes]
MVSKILLSEPNRELMEIPWKSSLMEASLFQNIYTLPDALFIGYKHSLDNVRSVVFSQSTSSTHLIEDEIFNDRDIMNNLVDYEDEQEEPDFLRADTIYAEI